MRLWKDIDETYLSQNATIFVLCVFPLIAWRKSAPFSFCASPLIDGENRHHFRLCVPLLIALEKIGTQNSSPGFVLSINSINGVLYGTHLLKKEKNEAPARRTCTAVPKSQDTRTGAFT